MDLEDVLAKKRENLEKLIRNEDEAIRMEMLKYEEAEFNIRLQSECFNLYPVVVKALSLLIADDKRRCIFCSILKGHKLEKLATYYHLTQEDVVRDFCSTVCELRRRVKEGAFTEKESVNIRLLLERNKLLSKLRTYDDRYEKLQLTNISLLEQIAQLQIDKEKVMKREADEKMEREQVMKKEVRQILSKEMERQAEEQMAKPSSYVSRITQWIRWLKMVYCRL